VADGNYVRNLLPEASGLVVQWEGMERDFNPGEQLRFSSDFDSVAVGVNPATYLDMILAYQSTGAVASRPVVFETGDYTHGVGYSGS
jgi:hypothetical protein